MKFKSFFVLWLPVLLWSGVIFSLSAIPTLPSPKIIWWDFVIKKTAHVTEYAILYFLIFRAISKKFTKKKYVKLALTSLVLSLTYAFSDEYHQSFVPGRHPKLMDVGFDSLGMLISLQLIKKKHY